MAAHHGHFSPAVYPPGSHGHSHLGHYSGQTSSQASLQPIAPRPGPFTSNSRHSTSFAAPLSTAMRVNAPSHHNHGPYSAIPNPLRGSEDTTSSSTIFTEQPHASVSDARLSREQGILETNLRLNAESGPSGLKVPAHLQAKHFESTMITDDSAMYDSDDDPPDPQDLVAHGHGNLLLPYSQRGSGVRTFSAIAENYALSEYMDYAYTSELRRRDMQTVFMHFISVTGPTMSLYERDPSFCESGARFDGDATLDNNLWTRMSTPVVSL